MSAIDGRIIYKHGPLPAAQAVFFMSAVKYGGKRGFIWRIREEIIY